MCLDSRGQCHLLYLAYRCYREIRLGDDAKGYPRWQGDPREKQSSKLYNAIADSDEVDRVIEAARLLKHNDESTFLIGDGKGLKLPRSCCISIGGGPSPPF